MSQSSSPLKLGKETFGTKKVEEVFIKALEMYFEKTKKLEE